MDENGYILTGNDKEFVEDTKIFLDILKDKKKNSALKILSSYLIIRGGKLKNLSENQILKLSIQYKEYSKDIFVEIFQNMKDIGLVQQKIQSNGGV